MRTLIVQLPNDLPHPAMAYPHAVVGDKPMAQALKLQWAPILYYIINFSIINYKLI